MFLMPHCQHLHQKSAASELCFLLKALATRKSVFLQKQSKKNQQYLSAVVFKPCVKAAISWSITILSFHCWTVGQASSGMHLTGHL